MSSQRIQIKAGDTGSIPRSGRFVEEEMLTTTVLWASLADHLQMNPPANAGDSVWLQISQKGKATHSSILLCWEFHTAIGLRVAKSWTMTEQLSLVYNYLLKILQFIK